MRWTVRGDFMRGRCWILLSPPLARLLYTELMDSMIDMKNITDCLKGISWTGSLKTMRSYYGYCHFGRKVGWWDFLFCLKSKSRREWQWKWYTDIVFTSKVTLLLVFRTLIQLMAFLCQIRAWRERRHHQRDHQSISRTPSLLFSQKVETSFITCDATIIVILKSLNWVRIFFSKESERHHLRHHSYLTHWESNFASLLHQESESVVIKEELIQQQ